MNGEEREGIFSTWNHNFSRSKYFSLQKWCSVDRNISVKRCNNNTSIISDFCCVVCMKKKNWSSGSSCVRSSNLSALTNPLTKLTQIASFSLNEPPKNNSLSNCSLLFLLSTLFVKKCCSAVLFLMQADFHG